MFGNPLVQEVPDITIFSVVTKMKEKVKVKLINLMFIRP
jgi:hypothetical protein